MTAVKKQHFTEAEYLAMEQVSDHRHEYVNGEIFMMVGVKAFHSVNLFNLSQLLGKTISEAGCVAHMGEFRLEIHTEQMDVHRYPDLWVQCRTSDLVTNNTSGENPEFIVEVLSESTRLVDCTTKRYEYREALRRCEGEYLMIDSVKEAAQLYS